MYRHTYIPNTYTCLFCLPIYINPGYGCSVGNGECMRWSNCSNGCIFFLKNVLAQIIIVCILINNCHGHGCKWVELQERQTVMNEYGLEPEEPQTAIDFNVWSFSGVKQLQTNTDWSLGNFKLLLTSKRGAPGASNRMQELHARACFVNMTNVSKRACACATTGASFSRLTRAVYVITSRRLIRGSASLPAGFIPVSSA